MRRELGLALALLVMGQSRITDAAASAAERAPACAPSLTLRWVSGEPIRLNVVRPDAAALQNPPFLRDPEIVSVVVGHDSFGATLTITFGHEAAAVMASETSTHIGAQMLIMEDDDVISAAILRDRLTDVMVFSGPGERVKNLAEKLTAHVAKTDDTQRSCS